MDGLRALACGLVLLGHTLLFAGDYPAGRFHSIVDIMPATGLTLFFVLSGFLLYRPFVDAVIRGADQPSARNYLRNRALRILPAYLVILFVIGLVLGVAILDAEAAMLDNDPGGKRVLLDEDFDGIGYLTAPGLLLQNLLLVQSYSPDGLLTGISPAWSLACEIVFYLVLPLLALWAARLAIGRGARGRVFAGLAPVALLFMVGIASKAFAIAVSDESASPLTQEWGSTWQAVFERSFLTQADMFALGMAAAVVVVLVSEGRLARLEPKHVARATAAAVVLMILFTATVRYDPRWWGTLVGILCAGLILTVVLRRDRTRLKGALRWRPVALFGLISYSVYLWHVPLIIWLREQNLTLSGRSGALVTIPVVTLVVVAASALTYRYVEAPAMSRKHSLKPQDRRVATAGRSVRPTI